MTYVQEDSPDWTSTWLKRVTHAAPKDASATLEERILSVVGEHKGGIKATDLNLALGTRHEKVRSVTREMCASGKLRCETVPGNRGTAKLFFVA